MSKRMHYRKRPMPPLDVLLAEAERLFEYKGGVLRRRVTVSWRAMAGDVAGGNDGHGYQSLNIMWQTYKVHQIVWLLCKREFPGMPIDHINRDRSDNRIENLRLASDLDNGANRSTTARPFCGVYKHAKGPNWIARIGVAGTKINLGTYPTREEAYAVYVEASRRVRGEFSSV